MPVEVLEAATVRHYTSRAEDPHWHLHLQLLSRVFAAGKWRGLHTVGVRDSLGAINGIGHAAMACDPELNAAFAAHGYTKDATGEILELAELRRPVQRAECADRPECGPLRTANGPPRTPANTPARRCAGRGTPAPGPTAARTRSPRSPGRTWTNAGGRELSALGYRDPAGPVDLTPTPVGALDRDAAVQRVLARLAAGRSAWNAADIRGEVERLIAAAGVVADAGGAHRAGRGPHRPRAGPLRAAAGSRRGARAHPGLDLAAGARRRGRPDRPPRRPRRRPAAPDPDLTPPVELAAGGARLDAGQAAAVAALAGDRPLVVVEGAAGAGKTTTLAATRTLLDDQGRRLVVVTPTLKAAKVAAAEVGAAAGSAAWLAFQHGWRWNDDGAWTRLARRRDRSGHRPASTPARPRGRGCGRGTCSSSTRPGCSTRTPPAPCSPSPTSAGCGWRCSATGTSCAAVGRGGVLDLAAGAGRPGRRT